jgi:dinuclear metal center YbgI/SA1388 family protein
MDRDKLSNYLIVLLKPGELSDSCPNGLQVEGRDKINKIITGVSASVELFKRAIKENAHAIIVHHGIIWDFERPLYAGAYKERIGLLLKNNLNLYAFHLPLDVHPRLGNNIKLAELLGIKNCQPFGEHKGQYIGLHGMINPVNKEKFFVKIENILRRKPLIFPYGPEKIKSIAIITGGAQKYIKEAVTKNIDAYITGEVSEHIMHYTKEEKIHFISGGHYATEKFGIIALSEHLAKKFKIKVKFIDIPNPV